jgi:hypothetical protein
MFNNQINNKMETGYINIINEKDKTPSVEMGFKKNLPRFFLILRARVFF